MNFGHSRGCNKASIIEHERDFEVEHTTAEASIIMDMRRVFLSFAGFVLLSVSPASSYSRSFLPRGVSSYYLASPS